MAALHDEILALRRLLVAVNGDDDPGISHAVELTQINNIVHRRRLLQEVLDEEPPQETPLAVYFARPDAVMHMKTLCTAYFCIQSLCEIARDLRRPKLCPFDNSFFLSAFAWIDFLLPFGDVSDLPVPTPDTRLVRMQLTTRALAFMSTFAHRSPRERVIALILDSRQRITSAIVNCWSRWRNVYDLASSEGSEAPIGFCVTLLPLYLEIVMNDETARAIIISDIRRVCGRKPRAFFSRCTRYIHELAVTFLYREASVCMPTFLFGVGTLLSVPNFGPVGSSSDRLTEAVWKTMSFNLDQGRPDLWRPSWGVVGPLCLRSPHVLSHLVSYGLFCSLVRLRIADPRIHSLAAVLGGIPQALDSVRAVNGFYATIENFKAANPAIQFTSREQGIIGRFEQQWQLLREASKTWDLCYTCCSAKCPNAGTPDPKLLSCSCGEALYCSKSCQRSHWDHEHRISCPSENVDKHGVLSAKAVHRFTVEAKACFKGLYASIPPAARSATGRPLHARLNVGDLSLELVGTSSEIYPDIEKLAVVIDYVFMQEERECVRRMYFVPEAWAGRVRPRYRPLTQAFINIPVPNAPTTLSNLALRERLFGRAVRS
ncbi:uncharacterized protein SCHCODRAFT_02559062 [Schizophyllum commune H4-8]|nr:uncharacterized protein SCHCODRAFT_02559062 [Schizophyllum commune H4-8]KAI5898987.1 hypothetical protein SCHCODRAFT_02559062 [Schizophyllum commune H4-8]